MNIKLYLLCLLPPIGVLYLDLQDTF